MAKPKTSDVVRMTQEGALEYHGYGIEDLRYENTRLEVGETMMIDWLVVQTSYINQPVQPWAEGPGSMGVDVLLSEVAPNQDVQAYIDSTDGELLGWKEPFPFWSEMLTTER